MTRHQPNARIDLEALDDIFSAVSISHQVAVVPDGRYVVRVVNIELKETRLGSPMLLWTLSILGPSHAGRHLFRTHVLNSENGMKWLKSDLQICNVTIVRLSELPEKGLDHGFANWTGEYVRVL